MAKLHRSSGLLMHPTSFPGPYGIGVLGQSAYQWIDFLAGARQSMWQILPLGPTGYGNSPYSTASVFAGNPLLIDLQRLVQEGLLDHAAIQETPGFTEHQVDFEAVLNWKLPLLDACYQKFRQNGNEMEQQSYEQFCRQHSEVWLDEFAAYMAIKNHFNGDSWQSWPDPYKLRHSRALADIKKELADNIASHKFIQFHFFKQWAELKAYANQKGIQIIGDIPIYVNFDSAEVWANQKMFLLDKAGNPESVAGVPPDYFSPTGQLWGNPLYNWKRMKKTGYSWWVDRIRITMETIDILRIDHFRGFESFYAVPYGEKTAENGQWVKGPGNDFFDALLAALGDIPIVVEDLGFITPAVKTLREDFDFPGMKILQFAFGGGPDEPFLPHKFSDNCLVYTGSHDNDTTRGWFEKAPHHERENCIRYLGGLHDDICWAMLRLASASTAVMSIFPLQDVLSLGSEARMNMPGKADGNWSWRLLPDQLQPHHTHRLKEITEIYGRAPRAEEKSDA